MATVIRRTFRSSPFRNTHDTWMAIVDLLTGGQSSEARKVLVAVAGIAASCIADQAPRSVPIVVTCNGPRTRIYCLYDDDALDGADAQEGALGFDALQGDWAISIPCHKDELPWVVGALAEHTTRITARDMADGLAADEKAAASNSLVLDVEEFMK
ncbi:hypothetical protein [Undibacterium danionis]|jgi:hypothetical protein|uniref:Uncharacterized protein n=1 Tax=Undibacterium danionis TaxID=1812100 RepID=A0ABV6ILJ8_9BURK